MSWKVRASGLLLVGLTLLLAVPAQAEEEETAEEREARILGLVEQEEEALAAPPEAAGRADPFVGSGHGSVRPLDRIRISELVLKGIVISGDERYALMLGPDDATHALRRGQGLADGRVKSIDPDGIVFTAKVNGRDGGTTERDVVVKLEPNP